MEDALTDTNLSSGREEEVEEKREADVEDGYEQRKGGGLLDNLIHNLVSPLSPTAGDKKVAVVDEEEEEVETSENERSKRTKTEKDHVGSDSTGRGGPGGGGLIKNVISNLFHPSEGQAVENGNKIIEQEEVKNVEENVKVKTQEEEGGGGIIDNIVSHLPASLLDDQAAPTTDEASILIHSIIHD